MRKTIARFWLLLPLIMLWTAACALVSTPVTLAPPLIAQPGSPFPLRFGEEAQVANTNITIRLAGTVDDSRCPITAECVWAGEVTAHVTLEENGSAVTFDMTLGDNPQTAVYITSQSYTVELLAVDPYPGTVDGNPAPEEVVVTLVFSN